MYDSHRTGIAVNRSLKRFTLILFPVLFSLMRSATVHAQTYAIPFDLESPTEVYELPHRLAEISDLALASNSLLVAVEDENGVLYFINPGSGKVAAEVRFASRGDYEGVTVFLGDIFVLRSDGTVFRVPELDTVGSATLPKRVDSEKIKSNILNRRCDAEGFTVNPAGTALWIGCKEKPGRDIDHARAIYAFDPNIDETSEEPVLLIERDFLVQNTSMKRSEFDRFKPSAIAVEPVTGNIYMISSVDRLLLVLSSTGEFLASHKFHKELLRQPEGLAFGPGGSLFIASEGAGKRAVLIRFERTVD